MSYVYTCSHHFRVILVQPSTRHYQVINQLHLDISCLLFHVNNGFVRHEVICLFENVSKIRGIDGVPINLLMNDHNDTTVTYYRKKIYTRCGCADKSNLHNSITEIYMIEDYITVCDNIFVLQYQRPILDVDGSWLRHE